MMLVKTIWSENNKSKSRPSFKQISVGIYSESARRNWHLSSNIADILRFFKPKM